MDDARIIAMFFERNEDGIKQAERQYKRYLQNIAKNILTSKEDVDECVNDTYLARMRFQPKTLQLASTALTAKS